MIISNWDTNWEFYTLFLLYKQNHPYFPLASNKLILAAKHSLGLVFKCSADGDICRRIVDYLPIEYLLYLVYDKSYNIITRHDIKEGKYSPMDFDICTPLGSICQHRFTHLSQYAPKTPILISNQSRSRDLRLKYLNHTF